MIFEPWASDFWFQVAFAQLAPWKKKGKKKGEKKISCLINWVDLAWKILRDTNGSLKHIFLIFNFKQSWWGANRVVNGVCRKKCIKAWWYHDGLWVFLFKSCYIIFLCCLFYDVCTSSPRLQLHLIMWLHTSILLCVPPVTSQASKEHATVSFRCDISEVLSHVSQIHTPWRLWEADTPAGLAKHLSQKYISKWTLRELSHSHILTMAGNISLFAVQCTFSIQS